MKTFKPDFKKITGLLGAGSMMISHIPVNAVAGDTEPGEDKCLLPTCQFTDKSCGGSSGPCKKNK